MEKPTKKKIFFEKTETIMSVDGEVVEHKSTSSAYAAKEPDFVKLYINDIMNLSNLPASSNSLLMALLGQVTYNNEIIIVKAIRERICKDLNIADVTFRKGMDKFIEKGILTKKDKYIYLMNPFLFGKGSWENISHIRLTVDYSKRGRFIIKENIQPELGFEGGQTQLSGVEFNEKIGTKPTTIALLG